MSQGLCPSCGAAVKLTAGRPDTKCQYCDSVVTLQQAEAQASEVMHSDMDLETSNPLRFTQVSEQQLRAAFDDDQGRGDIVILSQKPDVFIQAAGEGDGPYSLECQEGGVDRHFSSGDDFRKEDVLRAFLWYLARDDRWRTGFSWQKLDL